MTPKNPRPKPTPTRIGKAPVGRILLMFIGQLMNSHLSAESMRATMRGVYTYLHVPDLLLDVNLDKDIFLGMLSEIDLSVARSEKARKRAALRKSTRQSPTAIPASTVVPSITPATPSIIPAAPTLASTTVTTHALPPLDCALSVPNSASLLCSGSGASAPPLPKVTPAEPPSVESAPLPSPTAETSPQSPPVRPARKPARDPDEPAFTYRPPQEKPPKAYVIRDDEETEPYDPYGIRVAIKMQTRYGRLVRSNLW